MMRPAFWIQMQSIPLTEYGRQSDTFLGGPAGRDEPGRTGNSRWQEEELLGVEGPWVGEHGGR